jgi:hypothetical protein
MTVEWINLSYREVVICFIDSSRNSDQVREGEMGGTYNMHDEDEKCSQNFSLEI